MVVVVVVVAGGGLICRYHLGTYSRVLYILLVCESENAVLCVLLCLK